MNIFKFVTSLRALGYSFTFIGKLLTGLGLVLRGETTGSERPVTGSSSSNGAENEEPESEQGDLLAETDSRESDLRGRPPRHS